MNISDALDLLKNALNQGDAGINSQLTATGVPTNEFVSMRNYGLNNGSINGLGANYGTNPGNTIFGMDDATQLAWFGGKDPNGAVTNGIIPTAGSALSGLAQSWQGMKQLDLAEDQLNFQKKAFSQQFENQRTLTNNQLRDRQAARLAADPSAYESVDSYMKKYGV
ncbi:hypothetical protein [Marinobacterium litorale]|uniref:hypothetical protein n=1 Tax=Marinobacterium litorale TaxID=404770 RepID=UPI000686C9C2|nr:hypothetical protein [Marinobacterium litorale]